MKIRSYFRQPVFQAATLKIPNIADIPCEIINFCQAGLFLKLSGPDYDIGTACARAVAETVFTPPGKEITFRLTGIINHVSPIGIGFVFDRPPPFPVLQALQEKASSNPLSERSAPAELLAIHRHCLKAFENAFKPLLETLPSQIRTELTEVMNDGANLIAQNLHDRRIADFTQPLKLKPVVEEFYAHALEQARSFIVPDLSLQPEVGAIYSESTSQRLLVEDWMNLIDRVIQLEAKHEDMLGILASRFRTLVQRDIHNHDNPFGPSVLFHCFHYSLKEVILNNSQRNIVYDFFSRVLDKCLIGLYSDLMTLTKPLENWGTVTTKPEITKPETIPPLTLAGTGTTLQLEPIPTTDENRESDVPFPFHEPEPKGKPHFIPQETPTLSTKTSAATTFNLESDRPDITGNSANHRETADNAPLKISRAVNTPQQPDAFNAFVFLSRYAESQVNRGSTEAAADFNPAAIISALQELQQTNTDQQPQYFNAPRLQAGLGQILAEHREAACLSCLEARETLQIIGLLLDAILADTSIPVGIMPYFKKLQIPLLIAAFADPNLLHGKTHPAREVLNQLDYLALATNAQGEIDNEKLIHSLNKMMYRISTQVLSNPGVFLETLDSLKKLTAPLIKAYTTRLERIVETCEGGHRLEQARRLVEREIDLRIAGKTVPAIVPILIDAGWRQLLVLTNLRHGADDNEWRRQLSLLDLLLNRLNRNSPTNLPSQFDLLSLKSFILEGLSSIGAESADLNRLVDEIGELLVNGVAEPGALEYVDIPLADHERDVKEISLRARLQGFQVGDWLKFAASRSTWIPLRLTWIGQNPQRYVFVNRRGIKTLDLDAARFIQFLDEKRASRIESLEEFPLVERTAKTLLHTLRERLR